ncbi:hypothetical protein LSH36_152g04035 [Paralvinella palmiformis]|uniref:VWFA domain-containing protein n=1 Tax=Paralvinella palmiformis TaxID=53620 RepID=A0AAD9JUD4_9ANNE|nr:hypothetical protein LSH36_152g04035 [Paralvinella palmiformis]
MDVSTMETTIAVIFVSVCLLITLLYKCFSGLKKGGHHYPNPDNITRPNSLLRLFGVRHVNAIVDQFKTLDQVTDAVQKAGLESCNLIFGIDFTYSNLSQGERTFSGRSLHAIELHTMNPYQQVIKILGETLAPFDEDDVIPAFGFGDISTKDKSVFSFKVEGYCHGFEEVLACYEVIASRVVLSGPTNFAPLIHQAIDIVKYTKQYHILVIVADGQVTSERATREAIVEASRWPLSIILVGVGDGPWDMMQEFDDGLPARKFDNFQFVDFNRVLTFGTVLETTFALHALMEIPDQFKAIRRLGLLDF